MKFSVEDLNVILRALRMNYIDGPDDENHAEHLNVLISTIEKWLEYGQDSTS